MKRLLIALICLLSLSTLTSYAMATKRHLTLQIQYIGQKPSADTALNMQKTIQLDPCSNDTQVVGTAVKMVNDQPVTEAMLVQVEEVSKDQAKLKFKLLSYGFQQEGQVLSEPTLEIKNGQSAAISNNQEKWTFKATWS